MKEEKRREKEEMGDEEEGKWRKKIEGETYGKKEDERLKTKWNWKKKKRRKLREETWRKYKEKKSGGGNAGRRKTTMEEKRRKRNRRTEIERK